MSFIDAIRSEIEIDKRFFKSWGQATKKEWEEDSLNNVVTDVAGGAFDVVAWLRDNWQLVIVGFVALLVLLKD